MTKPKSAFITFEYSDAVNIMTSIKNKENENGKSLIKEANLPTNIIWESKRWSVKESIWNKIANLTCISIIMLVVWGFILFTRYQS
jgi:hypothetical protein